MKRKNRKIKKYDKVVTALDANIAPFENNGRYCKVAFDLLGYQWDEDPDSKEDVNAWANIYRNVVTGQLFAVGGTGMDENIYMREISIYSDLEEYLEKLND